MSEFPRIPSTRPGRAIRPLLPANPIQRKKRRPSYGEREDEPENKKSDLDEEAESEKGTPEDGGHIDLRV
jgi:hypothetical protein